MPEDLTQLKARLAAAVRWERVDEALAIKSQMVLIGVESDLHKRLAGRPPLSPEDFGRLVGVLATYTTPTTQTAATTRTDAELASV